MENTNTQIWENVGGELAKKIGEDNFQLWFKPVSLKTVDKESVTLSVPNRFFEDWIKNHYENDLTAQFSIHFGRGIKILFHQEKEIPRMEEKPVEHIIESIPRQEKTTDFTVLQQNHTFDNFVVGDCNKFARAAAEGICRDPGAMYNPLYLYGGVGLGKTHLLHAIGNRIRQLSPGLKLLYVSSSFMAGEAFGALPEGKMNIFNTKYQSLDVLLVDDIQLAPASDFFHSVFFDIFNRLYDNHKQIVICSDCEPNQLPKMEERLKSRFGWGLNVDIRQPDLETRILILRKKAEKEKIYVPDDVLVYIASKIRKSIRNMESSLTTLIANSSLMGSTITIDLARELLIIPREEELIEKAEMNISVERIKEVVSQDLHVSIEDLAGTSRKEEIAYARHIAIYLVRTLTNKSTIETGKYFGKDHSTIIYSEEKIKKKLSTSVSFNQFMNKIISIIKGGPSVEKK